MKVIKAGLAAGIASIALMVGGAHAATLTVLSTDNIYRPAGDSNGTAPPSVGVSGGDVVTFSATGSVSYNIGSGSNFNDPDGVGSAPATSSNSGFGSISGLTAPHAGFLVGVFVGSGGPSGPAPAALNYTGASPTTSDASYSPLLNQVFFIGDGQTGDGTGPTQQFTAPTGAVLLYLGLSDACNYNGGPSCYNDNQGSFLVSVAGNTTSTAAPLPAALPMFASGLAGLGWLARRRRKRTA